MSTARPSAILHKRRAELQAAPNLADHAEGVASFSRADARSELAGLPGGRGLNIAHEAVDRHARGTHANTVALRCFGKDDGRESGRELTYCQLAELSNRFANALEVLGIASTSTRWTSSTSSWAYINASESTCPRATIRGSARSMAA